MIFSVIFFTVESRNCALDLNAAEQSLSPLFFPTCDLILRGRSWMEQRGRMEWMSRSKKGGGGEVCVQKRGPDSFSPSAHLSPPPPKQRCWVGPSPSVPAAPSPYFPPSLDDASVSIAVLLCCFVAAHQNAVGRSHMSSSPPLPLVGWPKTLRSWQRIGYFQIKA